MVLNGVTPTVFPVQGHGIVLKKSVSIREIRLKSRRASAKKRQVVHCCSLLSWLFEKGGCLEKWCGCLCISCPCCLPFLVWLFEKNCVSEKAKLILLFRSACTMLRTCVLEDRLRLGNAQKYLAFRSACTMLTSSKIGCTSEMLKNIWHFARLALSLQAKKLYCCMVRRKPLNINNLYD